MKKQYKVDNPLEEELDMEFFANSSYKELKLNKGEKRALKFELNRGVEVDKIENLKGYLHEMTKKQNLKGKGSKNNTHIKEVHSIS
jgi:hypothetical protein